MSLYEDGLASMRGEVGGPFADQYFRRRFGINISGSIGAVKMADVYETAKKIETPLKAQKILVLSLGTLRKAAEMLSEYNFWDKAVGAMAANVDLIKQRMNYIARVQAEIPVTGVERLDPKIAEKVALAALQVTDTLNLTTTLVRQSQLEAGLRGLIRSFWAAFQKILEEIVKEIVIPAVKAAAIPLIPIALGTGAVLLLFSQLKKTAT